MKAGSLSGPLEDPFPVIQQTLYTYLNVTRIIASKSTLE